MSLTKTQAMQFAIKGFKPSIKKEEIYIIVLKPGYRDNDVIDINDKKSEEILKIIQKEKNNEY